jgi:hypothetical protein
MQASAKEKRPKVWIDTNLRMSCRLHGGNPAKPLIQPFRAQSGSVMMPVS